MDEVACNTQKPETTGISIYQKVIKKDDFRKKIVTSQLV